MPELLKFLFRHAMIGVGIATVATTAILYFDFGQIGSLASTSDVGAVAVLLLWFMLGLTYASVQMGFAVMIGLSEDKDESGGSPKRVPHPALQLALAPVCRTKS